MIILHGFFLCAHVAVPTDATCLSQYETLARYQPLIVGCSCRSNLPGLNLRLKFLCSFATQSSPNWLATTLSDWRKDSHNNDDDIIIVFIIVLRSEDCLNQLFLSIVLSLSWIDPPLSFLQWAMHWVEFQLNPLDGSSICTQKKKGQEKNVVLWMDGQSYSDKSIKVNLQRAAGWSLCVGDDFGEAPSLPFRGRWRKLQWQEVKHCLQFIQSKLNIVIRIQISELFSKLCARLWQICGWNCWIHNLLLIIISFVRRQLVLTSWVWNREAGCYTIYITT